MEQILGSSSNSYPGLGKKVRYVADPWDKKEFYPLGIHPNCAGSISEMLFVREVAMMIVMDRLSDKPDFHRKVFDDAIVARWIDEALAIPDNSLWDEIVLGNDGPDGQRVKRLKNILDKDCLEYCIQELRAKSKHFEKTGLIPTLDASAAVCKSDTLIDEALRDELRAAFVKLQAEQKSAPDWHPRTDDKVQDLVHPSLYPLVYGTTRVFADEVVGVDDAIDKWAGKGNIIPEPTGPGEVSDGFDGYGGLGIDPSCWSHKYQWLPANVKLQPDGSVKFTSYINNLHPLKHREVYGTIEKLIEKSIPAWDTCVAALRGWSGVSGRSSRFPFPDDPDDDNEDNWVPKLDEVETPRHSRAPSEAEVSGDESDAEEEFDEEDDYEDCDSESGDPYCGTRKEAKWKMIREPVQPQPLKFEAWKYGPSQGESLRERFDGLQIIVKMASIELTPEKPEFPVGGWHVEGQMNEHIVGTALYYLDSENITPSHLQFRMHTTYDIDDKFRVGQDNYKWMERVYGTRLGAGQDAPCLQNYGSVETKEGRLLAFPNVFHHRVSPFELKDKTKPGHRRFIALWLVDPLTRIISTANVPPQQQDWWMDRAFMNLKAAEANKVARPIAQTILDKAPSADNSGLKAAAEEGTHGLPVELMSMLADEFDDALPMSLEEAKEHRLKLMDIRTAFQGDAESRWEEQTYNFCEH
ncbi:unnamed protein product [Clonostachys rosea f. rosea IK726]|uniref:Uncharacterized protein n=2 Tax=Bionectria ochroleuca TaxID=29856 RepID=A0A0B7K6A8_BIOOC|nr:unnamed protein product [Clonostachys rosea f. rosea IK726]